MSEELVQQVMEICNTDEATARKYLEDNDWELDVVVDKLIVGNHSPPKPTSENIISAERFVPTSSNNRTVCDYSSTNAKVATFSSLRQNAASSDDEEEEGQAFYAGGAEHGGSGQQVLGPKKPKPSNPQDGTCSHSHSRDLVHEIFEAARSQGAEVLDSVEKAELMGQHQPRRIAFSGTGYRLGEHVDQSLIHSSSSRVETPPPSDSGETTVVLKMWQNGFSINEGDLRPYTDPESVELLESIKEGNVPVAVVKEARGKRVNLLLEDHQHDIWRPPAAASSKLNIFGGKGNMLGRPTPTIVWDDQEVCQELPAQEAPITEPSQPTTRIQVRLPDASRLVLTLNEEQTIGDLRRSVISQRPALANQTFTIFTSFPRTELVEDSQTLSRAKLLNASVVLALK